MVQCSTATGQDCFIQKLQQWMGARCEDTTSNHTDWITSKVHSDYEPPHGKSGGEPLPLWTRVPERGVCCGHAPNGTDFPYEPEEFDMCLANFVTFWNSPHIAQPNLVAPTNVFYDGNSGELAAVALHFSTTVQYKNTFESGNSFYLEVNGWFDKQKEGAPAKSGLRDGFFVSNFWFYAIQEALQRGASLSTLVSLAMAAAVLLVMTCNVFVSFLAALTIVAIVAAETGVLVLFGWTLGPIESVIFSVAVGMSVDFVSHLSHAYIHAKPPNRGWTEGQQRAWRVSEALSLMGVSISTAAVSTIVACSVMLSCKSIFFFEFGTFMVLVMTLSWAFSVLWLLPALSLLGIAKHAPGGDTSAKASASGSLPVGLSARAEDNNQAYSRVRTRTQSSELFDRPASPLSFDVDASSSRMSWASPLHAVAEDGSSGDEAFSSPLPDTPSPSWQNSAARASADSTKNAAPPQPPSPFEARARDSRDRRIWGFEG